MAFLSSSPVLRHVSLGRRSKVCGRRRPNNAATVAARVVGPDFGGSSAIENDPELEFPEEGVVDVIGADFDLVTKRKKVRAQTQQLLDEISKPPECVDGFPLASDADDLPPIENDENMKFVRTVVRAADERKGTDIVALRVAKITYITSFIFVVTGRSAPQLRAIANLIEEQMNKEHGEHPRQSSGTAQSGWILLDYGDLLVNIFLEKERQYYNLEGLWKAGEHADISDCVSPQSPQDDKKTEDENLDDWLS